MAEQTKDDGSRQDDVFYSRLTFDDRGDGLRFAREYKLDVINTDVDERQRPTITVLVTKEQIERLQSAGAQVEVGENASATGRERQKEVSTGDRFEGGKVPPKGLGRKVLEDR